MIITKGLRLLLLTALLALLTGAQEEDPAVTPEPLPEVDGEGDHVTQGRIEGGLDAMTVLSEILSAPDKFSDALGGVSTLGSRVKPLLESLSPLTSEVLTKTSSTDDETRKQIREQFQVFNSFLDYIESSFAYVPDTVPWSSEKSKYIEYSQTINNFKNKLLNLSRSESPDPYAKQIFQDYQFHYNAEGTKLKDLFVGDPSILDLYKNYTTNQDLIQELHMEGVRRMIEASQVEVGYLALQGFNGTTVVGKDEEINQKVGDWEKHINQVHEEMRPFYSAAPGVILLHILVINVVAFIIQTTLF